MNDLEEFRDALREVLGYQRPIPDEPTTVFERIASLLPATNQEIASATGIKMTLVSHYLCKFVKHKKIAVVGERRDKDLVRRIYGMVEPG